MVMERVWVLVFFFLIHLLLLLGTNRLTGTEPDVLRCAAAALAGSAYSMICMLKETSVFSGSLGRCLCLALMAGVAFGFPLRGLRKSGIFAAAGIMLEGAAEGIHRGNILPLLLGGCCLWLLAGRNTPGKRRRDPYQLVTISHDRKKVSMVALYDTGNMLRDPLTGEGVVVISPEIARRLTGLTREQLARPLETLTQHRIPGLRLIPYSSIGGSGFLLGKRFSQVTVGEKTGSAVVAFAIQDIGRGEAYQALTGGFV